MTRLLAQLRRLPATLARMGGYWGGITMWDRARAALTRRRG